jgi:hypothetical protein
MKIGTLVEVKANKYNRMRFYIESIENYIAYLGDIEGNPLYDFSGTRIKIHINNLKKVK